MTKASELPTYSEAWQLIADLRDADTCHSEYTTTSDIIDALVDAGYLKLAGDE